MGVAYDIAARLNQHIDEQFKLHHIAYSYQDPDEKSSRFRWYVCTCDKKQNYSRADFNEHQLDALKTVVMEPIKRGR